MNRKLTAWYIKFGLLLLLGGSIVGILNTLVVVTTTLTDGKKLNLIFPFLWEMTGAYSFTVLIPVMLVLFNRFPFKKKTFVKNAFIYLVVILLLGIIHTGLMYCSRTILYNIFHWGNYYYGYLPYRYAMETLKMSIGFFTVFAVYTLIKLNQERQKEKLRLVHLEEQLIKTRLDFLKSQINPHFLFNTLNMISSTMYESVEDADKMIANLCDLLRISLKSTNGVHSLKEEIDVLNLYLEIMRARFGDKLNIQLNIEDGTTKNLVPSFLLQPIVENSIKYGMENLSEVTGIKIISNNLDERLVITISDNGPGIYLAPEEVLKRGVGLSNIQERLERLYGNDFEFSWENINEGGLIVKISIPMKS